MYSEVYIDVVFLCNFFMDYLLLCLIGRVFSIRKRRMQCMLAAAAGGIYSCAVFCFPELSGNMGGILLHGLCGMLMLYLGLGFRRKGLLLKGILTFYLAAFLFGGVWETLTETGGKTLEAFFACMIGTYLFLSALHAWSDCFRARFQNVYGISLLYQGKKWDTCGFYDTGNLLLDSLSGQPVSVVRAEALKALLSTEYIEKMRHVLDNPGELENTDLLHLKPHLISFSTIGNQEGMMLAITLDELCIHTPKAVVRISGPVFALQYAASALGDEYEVLLNSRLLH